MAEKPVCYREVAFMLPETSVSFRCDSPALQRLYDTAEEKCLRNLQCFGSYPVLVEGGGYEKIWLETQPMSGEMYALRNPEAALNNSLLFMRCQREDGRLPGSIRCDRGRLIPEYNKYQGFCFPDHALNLYYLTGEDAGFLDELKKTLVRFDACLWRTRALYDDGLLRSFCMYDTGEDMAVRYGDAPGWWEPDEPPEGFQIVPMASMDVTSWSCAARQAIAEIAVIQGSEEEAAHWARLASEVRSALRRELWDEDRGTLFDRDRNGKRIPIVCHNPLRCMYWGALEPDMAGRFVREHLLNPAEFWTACPIPSVAVNDPAFRNAPENNWSGQTEGLTWQRAIQALERYGFSRIVTELGKKVMSTVIEGGYRFTQQYDPLTGKPSLVNAVTHQPVSAGSAEPVQDGYGPTLLAVLGYMEHRWGITPHRGKIWFSLGSGLACSWETVCFSHWYEIDSDGRRAVIRIDGREVFSRPCGVRLITDRQGRLLNTVPIEPEPGT